MCLGGKLQQMYLWTLKQQNSSPSLILKYKSSKFQLLLNPISQVVPHHKHNPLPPILPRNNIRTIQYNSKPILLSTSSLYRKHHHIRITRIRWTTNKEIIRGISKETSMAPTIRFNSNKIIYHHHQSKINGNNSHQYKIHLWQQRVWTRMLRNSCLYLQ